MSIIAESRPSMIVFHMLPDSFRAITLPHVTALTQTNNSVPRYFA